MTDDHFMGAALAELSDETRAAASACAAAQIEGRRLTPGQVMAVADAFADCALHDARKAFARRGRRRH